MRPARNKMSKLLGVTPKTQNVLPRHKPVLRGQIAALEEGTNALVGKSRVLEERAHLVLSYVSDSDAHPPLTHWLYFVQDFGF